MPMELLTKVSAAYESIQDIAKRLTKPRTIIFTINIFQESPYGLDPHLTIK